MRFLIFVLMLLSACVADKSKTCLGDFCLPTDADLVGHQRPADFDLYQVDWQGARFGIYVGDFPDFRIGSGAKRAVTIDADAELKINDMQRHILVQLGARSPRYLHITGPCIEAEGCALVNFADAIQKVK